MVLTYPDIMQLLGTGVVTNAGRELVNGSSLDITLGRTVLVEKKDKLTTVDLSNGQGLQYQTQVLTGAGVVLQPGEFVLAHSQQVFHLPDFLSADYKQKSSLARIGLQNLNAGWCDPGWSGSVLTLELQNCTRYHAIRIRPGDRIGQLVFHRHTPVPPEQSYALTGRYNHDTTVSAAKL